MGEYVLLRNAGQEAAPLAGWTLRDAAGAIYTVPTFTLATGAEVRVWVKAGADDATSLYWARPARLEQHRRHGNPARRGGLGGEPLHLHSLRHVRTAAAKSKLLCTAFREQGRHVVPDLDHVRETLTIDVANRRRDGKRDDRVVVRVASGLGKGQCERRKCRDGGHLCLLIVGRVGDHACVPSACLTPGSIRAASGGARLASVQLA